MSDQKLGSLYYTVGIQGMQSFMRDANSLRKQIVDIANTPIKSLLSDINIPDVASMQRTLNANRTNTINALQRALGSGTLNRKETDIASRALNFVRADSAATIGLFKSLQEQRRAFGERIGASADELKSIRTMIKAGESSGEIRSGSAFANNLRATAAHATVFESSMAGVNKAIAGSDVSLANSYDSYERSAKTAADLEKLAAATAKHKIAESLAVEKMEHAESQRISKAKRASSEYGAFEFEKMAAASKAGSANEALKNSRRITRQYVSEQIASGNVGVEGDKDVIKARAENALNAESTYRSRRIDALMSKNMSQLASAERAYEASPKSKADKEALNKEAMQYGIKERRVNERVAGERRLEEHALESSTDYTNGELRIKSKIADMDERAVHLSGRRQEIEDRVAQILGKQVSYAEKIKDEEEAALNVARQKSGGPLTPQQEDRIRRDARRQANRNLIGGDLAETGTRRNELEREINDIRSARGGASPKDKPLFDKRIRDLEAESKLLKNRETMLRRQALLENEMGKPGASWFEKRRMGKELDKIGIDLEQNEAQGENARRKAAGKRSRNANYRMQELSYGAQDFAQVLSGGGGLDAALRAANNNISQFFAAAGGPNAARYSLFATAAILGIAGALKYMGEMADLPAKRLDEVNDRLKVTQSLSKDLGRLFEIGNTSVGDISGESVLLSARSQSESERDARLQKQQVYNEAEIFGIRQKATFGEAAARNARINAGTAYNALGGVASLGGLMPNSLSDYFNNAASEFQDTGSKSDLGKVFKERFVDRKSSSEIENARGDLDPILITPRTRKYFDAILKSRDTSAESAVKAFKEIDEGGGWSDVPDEELKPFRESIQKLEEQLKRIRVAAVSFENALSSMSKNITSRNQLLSGASLQRRMASNSDDVSFINEQNELASQLEANAKANREEGLVAEAEKAEKDAAARRRIARMRIEGMNTGGEILTSQALSFEDRLAGFDKQMSEAKRMRDESGSGAGWIRGNQQMRDVRLAKENFLVEDTKSFSFDAQRSNESFAEADERMNKTYKEMTDSIKKNSGKSTAAADAAREKLDQAKSRQDSLNSAMRTYDSSDRLARAYGNRFDEQAVSIDLDYAKRTEKLKQDYSDKGSAAKLQQELAAEKAAYDRKKSELTKERDDYYKFSEGNRSAEAYGTSFDERRVAFERDSAMREDEINKNYAQPQQQAERLRQLAIEKDRQARKRAEIDRLEGRDRDDVNNMFAGQAAGLLGGRQQQHFANAQQLQDNLRAIEDAKAANPNLTDPDVDRMKMNAEAVFNERQKEIEAKKVGFSDIGGMWKQIQMSLKPDKSLEVQRIASEKMADIARMAGPGGAGLNVNIKMSP